MINPIRIIFGLVISLGVLGYAGYKVFDTKDAVNDAFDQVNRQLDPNAPTGGANADSMFRAKNLGEGYGKLKATVGENGRVMFLSVYPGYLVGEVKDRAESTSSISYKVEADGDTINVPLPSISAISGGSNRNGVAFADMDAGVIERIVDQIREQDPSVDLDRITHAVFGIDPAGARTPTWKVYVKAGASYEADANGRNVQKGGASTTTPTPGTTSTPGDDGDVSVGKGAKTNDPTALALKRLECVQAAQGDPQKLAACVR